MSQRKYSLLVKAVCVVVGLTASLTAQQPPETDPVLILRADAQRRADWATEWLRSEDPLRIAWGAWLARQDHQTALIPLLIEKVKQYQPVEEFSSQTAERDRHDALLAVLDALIELGAIVPVNEAHRLYPEFAAQSLILLVRSQTDAHSALFEIFHKARMNRNWLAVGNVLVKRLPPGFAALLLARFTQHMTVLVFDPHSGGDFASGGGECGFSPGVPKARWPSVGVYVLTQFPERLGLTATFLVGGDTAVYYWRVEPGYDNPPDAPSVCDDGNRDQYRAQYLNRLVQSSYPRINLESYPKITISWEGETDYRGRLLAAVEDQRVDFRRAVALLQQSGEVLTPTEAAALKPRLEIVVLDERTDRSTPLPPALENETGVAVRTSFTNPLY